MSKTTEHSIIEALAVLTGGIALLAENVPIKALSPRVSSTELLRRPDAANIWQIGVYGLPIIHPPSQREQNHGSNLLKVRSQSVHGETFAALEFYRGIDSVEELRT